LTTLLQSKSNDANFLQFARGGAVRVVSQSHEISK
jgi:hypothetical protein